MKNFKTLITMFQKVIYIFNKSQRKKSVGLFFSMMFVSILETLGVSVVIPFILAILTPDDLLNNEYILIVRKYIPINTYQSVIIFTAVAIIVVYIVKNAFILLSNYFQLRFRNGLERDLSCMMLDSYMERPYSFFLNTNSAEILRGVNNDIVAVAQVVDNFFVLLSEGITCLLIGTFLITLSPVMAVGIIGVIGICALGIVLIFKKKTAVCGDRCREIFALRTQYAYQAVNGIKEITVMQRRKYFTDQYRKVSDEASKNNTTYLFISKMPSRVIETVFIGGLLGLASFCMNLTADTTDFITQIGALAVASVRMLPAISNITGSVNMLVYYRPSLEAAHDNVKEVREYKKELETIVDSTGSYSFQQNLSINDITWRYESSNKDVLKNLNLKIEKGEAVAFIGESGAGKTTLADVILGLFHPQKGSIVMDGVDITTIPLQWSKIIGYVPQSVFLIDDTLRNNVSFGIPEEEIDDELIWQALEQAQLKEFVEKLPNGLDTMVGERGVKFSGGQRQRVAIARALYYNPDILVLDEATSALDAETETAVMEAIEALQGIKTLIIVAHRLSTIRNCNRIVEIKEGQAFLKDKKELFPE